MWPVCGTDTGERERLTYGNLRGFHSLWSETEWSSDLVAVRGVMGEPVSATVEPGFPVFTENCRDFSASASESYELTR